MPTIMTLYPDHHINYQLPLVACSNCGNPIGIHETPQLWCGTTMVCSVCYEKLQGRQMKSRAFGSAAAGLNEARFATR
jgi:hypothetical protein